MLRGKMGMNQFTLMTLDAILQTQKQPFTILAYFSKFKSRAR